MTEFDNIYELLESVRLYKLRPKECLIPWSSVTGQTIGYATADGDFPSILWTIPLKLAKETALDRGTREADHIRDLLSSYMGRKQLLEELRKGTLEYGVARPPPPAFRREYQGEPVEAHPLDCECGDERCRGSRKGTTEPKAGPVQCFIPGL